MITCVVGENCTIAVLLEVSLVPRPLPDFISQPDFIHASEIKSGSGLGMRLVGSHLSKLQLSELVGYPNAFSKPHPLFPATFVNGKLALVWAAISSSCVNAPNILWC